ncbi:putative disease resistance protein isoform X1 [Iris pallida]|uniref:Disease resistance protein isoform X1 n=1 Tax=Iris pallida TaxID=29817 RepID=A0AAX6GK84_IRIPA|nr:putative disease resistance protein isoform X1 [Iris pallida]
MKGICCTLGKSFPPLRILFLNSSCNIPDTSNFLRDAKCSKPSGVVDKLLQLSIVNWARSFIAPLSISRYLNPAKRTSRRCCSRGNPPLKYISSSKIVHCRICRTTRPCNPSSAATVSCASSNFSNDRLMRFWDSPLEPVYGSKLNFEKPEPERVNLRKLRWLGKELKSVVGGGGPSN